MIISSQSIGAVVTETERIGGFSGQVNAGLSDAAPSQSKPVPTVLYWPTRTHKTEDDMMQPMAISQHARALYRTHGDKAEAEAAQRERIAAQEGKQTIAADWRKIRAQVRQMRGANQT